MATRWQDYSDRYKANYRLNKADKLNKNKLWKEANPHKFLYNSCRQRAKAAGIEFSLTPEDIFVPDLCPVFLVPMKFATRFAPSVDRVDNGKGYHKDNIVVISLLANKMKNCATKEELDLFCSNIRTVLSNNMKNQPDLNDLWKPE